MVNFDNLEYLQIAYQEFLSNLSTLSLGYKELKRKLSKLSKDFESLEKENSILKKENEKLKEEQTNDLSKFHTSKVTQTQKEVLDLRQSLAKFKQINCSTYKKFGRKSYDYREHPKEPSKPSRTNLKGPKKIWVCLIIGKKSMSWYLDSGCSHHIKGEKIETQSTEHNEHDVSLNKGECIVRDCNDSIIFYDKRQNNLYKIDLTDLTNQNVTCLVSINDDQ
ncbi:hypothetical protein CR513_05750, partial [Mucuna pruriens]